MSLFACLATRDINDLVGPEFHFAPDMYPLFSKGLGGSINGVLRQYGVFPDQDIMHVPRSLTMLESSTLNFAALDAWNVLLGLEDRASVRGMRVLTQGTSGMSLFTE